MRSYSHKWLASYLAIGVISTVLVVLIHFKSEQDYQAALDYYQRDSRDEAMIATSKFTDSLGYIYQGLRTISLLPGVKNIDRYGKNMDSNAHKAITEIYNNMSSNIAVSEVYIVPADLKPDMLDHVTGRLQEPIMMFDSEIAEHGDHLKEVEIYEYRLLSRQMAYLKQHYPNVTTVKESTLPFISGPEVITCDNTEYTTSHNDEDRKGLLFSVPFYGQDGKLKGTISAIIRSNILRKLLPPSHFALINQQNHYILASRIPGQVTLSYPYITQNKADPNLLFSVILPITSHDPSSHWQIWAGYPDALFRHSATVKAIRNFTYFGYGFVIILTLLSASLLLMLFRSFKVMKRHNAELEKNVRHRTIELEHHMALTELLKSIAVAANEATSINEGLQIGIDSICNYTGWPIGHAYLYSEEKQALINLDVWHMMPPERYINFKHISESMQFSRGEGFVGEVYADSTPMWIVDIASSSVCNRRDAAVEAGLNIAFGFPVFVGRRAVAVMEFYSEDSRLPDEHLLDAMANVGKQLGQAIERSLLQEKAEISAKELQNSLHKAEEASRAKSDFLANMSHELRTPMNGVLGMAHLLGDTFLDEEQQEFVTTINDSAESLLMLLNDILDFSKIEAGALVLEHIPFKPSDSIMKTVNLLHPQADSKHIELITDMDTDVPDSIWGDPGRFRQIVINLVGNAVKFTDNGYVRISARMQEFDQHPFLHIRIEDTGMGIPPSKLSSIFDKFTQGDETVTRKYGGTGLGLAICKQLVTMMGGTIGVESAERKGSTFWFSIPCKSASSDEFFCHSDSHENLKTSSEALMPINLARALLVEDYPVNQVFAEKLLRKFGFTHVDIAANGIEAFNKYQVHEYDVIFMDCQMPELDGYQTTEKIRQLEAITGRHTPIVAMTANAMMGDREKCLKSGMDDYVSKPLRAEHVRTILKMLFLCDDPFVVPITKKIEQSTEETEAPVDMSQLHMFSGDDPEEEKELIELFLEQANDIFHVLENSMGNNDAWQSAAHRFKGAAGNFGAMKLHYYCKRAESHYDDSLDRKKEMLGIISLELKRVQTFLGR